MNKVCSIVPDKFNNIREMFRDRRPLLDRSLSPDEAKLEFQLLVSPTSKLTEQEFSKCVSFITLTFGPKADTHSIIDTEERDIFIEMKKSHNWMQIRQNKVVRAVQKDAIVLMKKAGNFFKGFSPHVHGIMVPEFTKNHDLHFHGILITKNAYQMARFRKKWQSNYGFTYSSEKFSMEGWIDYCIKDVGTTGLHRLYI